MKSICTLAVGLVLGWITAAPALAQDAIPEEPGGTLRVGEDHRHFATLGGSTLFVNPATGLEGFATYWPDGVLVTTVKRRDGTLVHNLGTYRIDGDLWCQTLRLPVNGKEVCQRSYLVGHNTFEAWGVEGEFLATWQFWAK
jgi:hypothetical protein